MNNRKCKICKKTLVGKERFLCSSCKNKIKNGIIKFGTAVCTVAPAVVYAASKIKRKSKEIPEHKNNY